MDLVKEDMKSDGQMVGLDGGHSLALETSEGNSQRKTKGVSLNSHPSFILQAARNCLVSKNNEVKVSDFGMTR